MKITIGKLRKIIAEEAAATSRSEDPDAAAEGDLVAAVDELFAAAGGSPKLVAAALKSWHKRFAKDGFKLSVTQSWLFSSGFGPLSNPAAKGQLSSTQLLEFIKKSLGGGYSARFSLTVPEVTEWLRGAVIEEVERIKAKVASQKGGESPDAPLGRFAWPDDRVSSAKVPWEPDTKEESALLNSINGYFAYNDNIPPEAAEKLLSMYQQGLYSDVLKAPTAEFVYRGMGVGSKWLKKLLHLGPDDAIPPDGTSEVEASYKASRGSAISWSIDRKVALDFARGSFKNRRDTGAEYTLLVTARVSDNPKVFLTCPGGLYNLKVPNGYRKESEVLALDSVKLHSIEWRSVAAAEADYNAKKAAAAAAKKKKGQKK